LRGRRPAPSDRSRLRRRIGSAGASVLRVTIFGSAASMGPATGEIAADRARETLDDLAALALHRYPHQFLAPRVWELRRNLTACDAACVALADAPDAPLLTGDQRLADPVEHRGIGRKGLR